MTDERPSLSLQKTPNTPDEVIGTVARPVRLIMAPLIGLH